MVESCAGAGRDGARTKKNPNESRGTDSENPKRDRENPSEGRSKRQVRVHSVDYVVSVLKVPMCVGRVVRDSLAQLVAASDDGS